MTAEIVNDNGDPNADPLSGGWQLKLRRRRLDLAGAPVRDDAGELVHDEAHIVLPAEKIRDGSWPELLPWAGLIHDFTPAGKSRALSAATLVQPFPAEMLRRYTSTGWRTLPDGRDMFVHAGGGITAAGPIPLDEVAVTGKLRVFDMPSADAGSGGSEDGGAGGFLPLLDLPAAVVAPLIGFAFRGIFGSPRASIHLVGDPGSGKTGITRAAAMHWFARGDAGTRQQAPARRCSPARTRSGTASRVCSASCTRPPTSRCWSTISRARRRPPGWVTCSPRSGTAGTGRWAPVPAAA